MFDYDVVPVMITRGAGGSEAASEWEAVRTALNERGRQGYRVVAVSDGAEGRAIIMERRTEQEASASAVSLAEEITRDAAVSDPIP